MKSMLKRWGIGLCALVGVGGVYAAPLIIYSAAVTNENWGDFWRAAATPYGATTAGLFALSAGGLAFYNGHEERKVNQAVEDRRHDAETIRTLRERYTAAVEQLANDSTTISQAGVYAIAALADDWLSITQTADAQVCINLLCAYLRSAPVDASATELPPDQPVRDTIMRTIAAHLTAPDPDESAGTASKTWRDLDYDFTGAHLYDVNLDRVVFRGERTDFTDVHFHGQKASFRETEFRASRTRFERAEFHNRITSFHDAKFHSEHTAFFGTKFNGVSVFFTNAQFLGDAIHFEDAVFMNQSVTSFAGAQVWCRKDISFDVAEFHSSRTNFDSAEFHTPVATFADVQFDSRRTSFQNVQFYTDQASFMRSGFDGKTTSFREAQFHGTSLIFDEAKFRAETTSFIDAEFSSSSTSFRAASFNGAGASFRHAKFASDTTTFALVKFETTNLCEFVDPAAWKSMVFDWDEDLSKKPDSVTPAKWPPLASDPDDAAEEKLRENGPGGRAGRMARGLTVAQRLRGRLAPKRR
ncbi:hypothetical protein QBL07_024255 (plasmid) [Gordonia rubripertincta]|uniref:Pentapeptide repeat-containing protein n=2 Tax=Gordonia rubripertincta TaxID=36822 RepID=A0AAW6RF69_GORRU|nr:MULTISPECIES: hypothetical protein [Gordonia]MDG6783085.1 hypothetical protein [Gordonia rubripertincta]NKY65413.1 hypothetical protein [Gordonia rubripertincta]GAB86845.1 hypothetical protein GORBP_082_00140 [Gordonia rubripertincta NBRC 101908]